MTDIATIDGIDYKVGVRGFVYYCDAFGDWVRSTKSETEVKRALRRAALVPSELPEIEPEPEPEVVVKKPVVAKKETIKAGMLRVLANSDESMTRAEIAAALKVERSSVGPALRDHLGTRHILRAAKKRVEGQRQTAQAFRVNRNKVRRVA